MAKYDELSSKLTELRDFYNQNKDKINTSYDCCVAHPCSKVSDEISSLVSAINSELSKASGWDDSAKDSLSDGINTFVKSLNSITTSISTSWVNAENLYKNNYDILSEINKLISDMQSKLDSYPEKSDYKEVTYDPETHERHESYPGYDDAMTSWEDGVSGLISDADSKIKSVNDNFSKLNGINGASVSVQTSVNLGAFSTTTTEYEGVKVALDNDEDVSNWLANNQKYYKKSGYTIRFSQSKGTPWTSEKLHGVSLRNSGCGILSIATCLSSTLSELNGKQVVVTPNQVMDGLNAYCNKHNVSLSNIISNKGFRGANETTAKAISEVWNVDVMASTRGLTKDETINTVKGNSSVLYSKANEGHLAAATEYIDKKNFVIADTRTGRATYLEGSNDYESKYAFVISKGMFEQKDGDVYDKEGNLIFKDKEIYSEY